MKSVIKIFIAIVLFFSGIACSPGNTTNYITSNGADKKLPDDDGYTGSGGTGDGGGGQGIACSEKVSDERLRSKLVIRDIFELIYNSNAKIVSHTLVENHSSTDLSDAAIKLLVQQLRSYFGPATDDLEFGDEDFWRAFGKKIHFIEKDASLYVSNDANSPVALPAGCNVVQIAFWNDQPGKASDGTLFVQKGLWMRLDQLNRVALLAHEYFFKEARSAGQKNSDFIRGKIGLLFSEDGLKPLFSKWESSKSAHSNSFLPYDPTGFKFCTGTVAEDPKAKVILYQYQGSDNSQRFVIPYLRSSKIMKSSLAPTDFDSVKTESSSLDYMYLNSESIETSIRSDDEEYFRFLFRRIGIHNSDLSGHGVLTRLKNKTFGVSGHQLWQDIIELGSGRGKVSLKIPAREAAGLIKLGKTPKEETSRLIVSMIAQEFQTKASNARIALSDLDSTNAVLALKKDIQNAFQSGVLSEGFPLWQKNLIAMDPEASKIAHDPNLSDVLFSGDANLSDNYPTLLLKSEAGLLTESDVEFIESYFNDQILVPISQLLVESNGVSVAFKLVCKDYEATYSLKKNIYADLGERKSHWEKINFKIDPAIGKTREIEWSTNKKYYKKVLELIENLAKKHFQTEDRCSPKYYDSNDGKCSGIYQLLRLFAYKKYSGVAPEVSGCSYSDINFSMDISSRYYAMIPQYVCLSLNVSGTWFFQVLVKANADDFESSPMYVIPQAPPGSYKEIAN